MRSLFFALIRWIACTSYGLDGKGIADTSINTDGYLIITYTDGSTQNAGKVISSGSSDTNDYALGSIITMGTFEQDNDTSNGAEPIEWIVVQRLENKALLLSKNVLECGLDKSYVEWYRKVLVGSNFFLHQYTKKYTIFAVRYSDL